LLFLTVYKKYIYILTTSRPDIVYKRAGRWQCRVGWPFINGLPVPCLWALPGSALHRDLVPAVSSGHSEHRSSDGTSV
ncbi:unnamed protein product, partial [Staurois parvus]